MFTILQGISVSFTEPKLFNVFQQVAFKNFDNWAYNLVTKE